MTDLQQVTRAGPSQASGRFCASASRKDRQFASSFFDALENERKIERDRSDEPRSKLQVEKEDDKPRDPKEFSPAAGDPGLLAGAYTSPPAGQPDQPPADGEPGGANEARPAAPVNEAGSEAPVATAAPAGPAKAGSVQAAATLADAASLETEAAPVAAPAGAQDGAPQAAAVVQTGELNPGALQSPALQAQPADPASVAQRLANELKITGAAQVQSSKPAAEAQLTQQSAGDAKTGSEQQPGQDQSKAALATPNAALQASVEGTKAPASQVFEPARLAEAQNKDAVWQICQNIESMVKNRQPALRLVLYPEELGRIDLRLTTSGAGLGVTITAEQASTNKLLESQMAQLRQALNDAGIQLSHFNIGQQQSQSNSGNANLPSHGSRSGRSFKQAAVENQVEVQAAGRSDTSEIVDYKI